MARRVEKIILEKMEPAGGSKKQPEHPKLRVAAYCRVSTDMEDQRSSFQAQVKAYTQLIGANREWVFAGMFADEGFSGTSAEKRPQFMKMMQACEEGKIDLILTKSISRFARNTLECLTYVRHLKSLGVNIVFESNGIDTRTQFSEMILTVLAAFAQEESRSISENTIWGIRKRFEEGNTRWCRLYGYEKNEIGEYQIVPEKAAIVQKVFQLYERGNTITEIRKIMEAEGIKSPNGVKTWSQSAVQTMIMNERYCGDLLLQKFYTENHISHKAIKNDCTEIPSYYIEEHHEPIISREQFERVQLIRSMRRLQHSRADEVMGACNQYPFGEKLRCPYCGSRLYQRAVKVQTNSRPGWCCERGEAACHGFVLRSNLLEKAVLEAYDHLDLEIFRQRISEPETRAEAEKLLQIKEQYPAFPKVDYWWVDELIDHIGFGQHSKTPREYLRMAALGKGTEDDRTVLIYWKCGPISSVSSGVQNDQDHPAKLAALLQEHRKRRTEKNQEKIEEAEAV